MKIIFLILVVSVCGFAQSREQSGYIGQTQANRKSQRFSMYDWLMRNKQIVAEQNSRMRGGTISPGPQPDLVLQYRADRQYVRRGSTAMGEDERGTAKIQFLLDDLFSGGNKTRSFNMDVGIEGFYSKTANFKPAEGITQSSHTYTETGGGLLIRPFGRSSQDTGLLFKGGYIDVDYVGLWTNSNELKKAYGFYVGGEVKLYLLPFFGLYGDYMAVLKQSIDAGKWNMYRFIYGAFLEIYLLNFQAYIIESNFTLTPEGGGSQTEEFSRGVGFGLAAYF